jgi:cytoskeletal protein RodZ
LSQPLRQFFSADEADSLLKEIIDWTGGQPFLTQKVCNLLCKFPLKGDLTALIQTFVINNWEAQDIPQHFKTIRDRILSNTEQQPAALLGVVQQILQSSKDLTGLKADNSNLQMALCLTGLVVKRQGVLQIYNPIYAEIFNLAWVEQELAQLRPYSENISAWFNTEKKDVSRLLRGQALQDALQWARGKNLPIDDDEFLEACRAEEAKQKEKAAQRQRLKVLLIVVLVSLIVTLLGAGFGAVQWQNAEITKNKAQRSQSLFLSNLSHQQVKQGDAVTGMLLALDALPQSVDKPNRPYVTEAYDALYYASTQPRERLSVQHQNSVSTAVFSPDGKTFVTASADKTAKVWNASSGQLLFTLTGHEAEVWSAVYSPDGKTIVTTSNDNTAKLWNASNGQLLFTLTGHEAEVWSAVYSPDGKTIVTASWDKTAKIWHILSPQELIDYANANVPRQLTPEQRKKFFLDE